VLNQQVSNYDSDLFHPIFHKIQEVCKNLVNDY
jgi:hypothetical protein